MEKQKKKKVKKVGNFFVAGVAAAIVDYVVYEIIARIINNNDFLFIPAIISGVFSVLVSYLMNSRITWKTQKTDKHGILRFFGWNFVKVVVLKPVLTIVFGFLPQIYEFAFMISNLIGLPFDFDFIESTGIFCFVTASTMILSYFIYDRLVFGRKKEQWGEQENMKSVGKAGEK